MQALKGLWGLLSLNGLFWDAFVKPVYFYIRFRWGMRPFISNGCISALFPDPLRFRSSSINTNNSPNVSSMLGHAGPSLYCHWANVSCLLGNKQLLTQQTMPNIETALGQRLVLAGWVGEYRFTSLSAQSWQYRDRRKPYFYFEWLQVFFIVQSTIGSTVHSMLLNSLEHCLCTTTMTNIRPDPPSSINLSATGRLLDITHICAMPIRPPSSLAYSDKWRHNEYSSCSHPSC